MPGHSHFFDTAKTSLWFLQRYTQTTSAGCAWVPKKRDTVSISCHTPTFKKAVQPVQPLECKHKKSHGSPSSKICRRNRSKSLSQLPFQPRPESIHRPPPPFQQPVPLPLNHLSFLQARANEAHLLIVCHGSDLKKERAPTNQTRPTSRSAVLYSPGMVGCTVLPVCLFRLKISHGRTLKLTRSHRSPICG